MKGLIIMNEHQLSLRLSAVAQLVPTGSRLADIGTDHAYLPVYLILQGKVSMAIAGELNDGPFQSAIQLVDRLSLDSVVDVRKGDGLEVLQEDEVDVITIAGMGGALIADILSKGLEKLRKVKRLVLQPNVAGHIVREWFIEHGWNLIDEMMIKEDQKYYEVLVAEQGEPELAYQGLESEERSRAIFMGPFLIKEKNEAFVEKWQVEIEKRKLILDSLQKAGQIQEEKYEQVMREVILMEGGL